MLAFNDLLAAIKEKQNILFVCHKNPDPDTVGSALALGRFVESLGKETEYFCAHKIPENFRLLDGANNFSHDEKVFLKERDLIIFLDCAEKSRCGIGGVERFKRQMWISVDHHIFKEKFADIEIRDPDASATTEIIYDFFMHGKIRIDSRTATALLSGILLDTRFLSNAATTAKSIKIAGELVAMGADYRKILAAFHLNKSEDALRLWGEALSRLKYNEDKDLVTTAIFRNDVKSDEILLEEAVSGLSGFLNAVLRAEIVMVLQEVENGVRGSLRTASGNVNVAEMAEEYGGGGHQKAAGFICDGHIIVEKENEWSMERGALTSR